MELLSSAKYNWLEVTIKNGSTTTVESIFVSKNNNELKEFISDLENCLEDAKSLLEEGGK